MTKRTERRKGKPDCHCSIPTLVVWFLGIIALELCTEIGVLLFIGREIPSEMYMLATGAIAGVAALLTNTRTQQQGATPQPVTVENAADSPVPVETAPVEEAPVEEAPIDEVPQDEEAPVAPPKKSGKAKS